MNISEPFVLKRDVVLTPCAELAEDVRRRIDFDEGDFTLQMRRSRTVIRVIDGETAALLNRFREPRTLADAIVENSRAFGKSPVAVFDELLPHLVTLVSTRVLVPAGADDEHEVSARYEPGATIAGWTVVRCVSLVEDTEVYEVREGERTAALKIARVMKPGMQALFENEIAVLEHLDGTFAPRLIEHGMHEDRPYVVIDWIAGPPAVVAAARLRNDRPRLLALCASIAAAYAALHARGVIHGDVHLRNVIAGDDGVTVIDFGYAHIRGVPPRTGRAGVLFFREPEFDPWKVPTAEGEQYALGALLYFLITGSHSIDFRLEREEMLRQIANDPPRPFAEHSIPPWPDVEQILFRALEKDPARRHASIAEMAALLEGARDAAATAAREVPLAADVQPFFEATLGAYARGGQLFAEGLRFADVTFGCAGIAAGLLRIAESRNDAALLALAEVWQSRANALMARGDAFPSSSSEAARAKIGDLNPWFNESGVHATQALLAAATGDVRTERRAIASFLASSERPCAKVDLTLGRSGTLLTAAMLLAIHDEPRLRALGSATMNGIWSELDAEPPLALDQENLWFGMAHGWTGYFYAALRWCSASGDPLPSRLVERLHEFAALRMTIDGDTGWPVQTGQLTILSNWCNGSAGHVFLFTLAHRMLGDGQWLRFAESCARSTSDAPADRHMLCCGSAGRAYALLNLYKHTGEREWLGRAHRLANESVREGLWDAHPHSLWRGRLGIAALIADLASPEHARMPFFE